MTEKTCSNCVHVDVCENRFSWLDQEDNTKHIICHHFKDKADVVEVVRCKDCVSSRPLRRNDRFEALFAEGCVYCMRNDDGVDNEHFCSYGERKDNNR